MVSDDGKVAAGFAENTLTRSPAIWGADGAGFLIDPTDVETTYVLRLPITAL